MVVIAITLEDDGNGGVFMDMKTRINAQGSSPSLLPGAMHNWHRALCSTSDEAEWGGEFDPAYQPQQVLHFIYDDAIIIIIIIIIMIGIC